MKKYTNAKIFCSFTIFNLVGCSDQSLPSKDSLQGPTIVISTDEKPVTDTHSFGDFSISIPDGWTVVTPDREKTKAMLVLGGTDWRNAKAMIKVDVGKPTASSPKRLAEDYAKSVGAIVSEESMDFDGVPGVCATTTSTNLRMPRNMIIVFRADQAYLIMVGATDNIETYEAISQIRRSWKWTFPEAR